MSQSLILPVGFALFEERSEPLFKIGTAADAGVFENRALQILVNAGGSTGGKELLGARDADGTGRNEEFSEFLCAIEQFLRGNDLVDQTKFLGFDSGDQSTCEQEITRALFSDLARKEDTDNGGKKTDLDFGVPELRFGDGESEITKCSYSATPRQRMAIYSGD